MSEQTLQIMPLMWTILDRLKVSPRTLAVYVALYLPVGFFMNGFGKVTQIAEFTYWWQVLTCYGLYLIPCSLVVRRDSWWHQYLFGLFALCLLELAGYSLETSIAHDGNILDAIFGERNFALVMSIWFGLYIPAGNAAVAAIEKKLFETAQ